MYQVHRARFHTYRRYGGGFRLGGGARGGFKRPRRIGYPYRGRTHHLFAYGAFAPLRNGGFGGPVPHQPELKAMDVSFTLSLPASTNAITSGQGTVATTQYQIQYLNLSVQGTSIFDRIGQKTIMQKLVLKLLLGNLRDVSSVYGAGYVRILVVYDAQLNGIPLSAAAAATALLQNPVDLVSPMNLDNRERFRIVLDKFFYLGATLMSATSEENTYSTDRNDAFTKKFKQNMKLDTIYNQGNAGTAGDIQSGGLFMLACTDKYSDDGTGASAFVKTYSRIRFFDC